MQILRPHSRPTELEILGVGLSNSCLTSSPGDSAQYQSLKTTAIQNKATFTLKKYLHLVPGSHLLGMVWRKFFFSKYMRNA